jgi:hypothetical protein
VMCQGLSHSLQLAFTIINGSNGYKVIRRLFGHNLPCDHKRDHPFSMPVIYGIHDEVSEKWASPPPNPNVLDRPRGIRYSIKELVCLAS